MEIIKNKKKLFTFSLKEDVVKAFKKQSYEISESMSSRIEEFMKKELKKGENNEENRI